jgi:hypothetical protein
MKNHPLSSKKLKIPIVKIIPPLEKQAPNPSDPPPTPSKLNNQKT